MCSAPFGQEAIANTLKHAQAQKLQVELRFNAGLVQLQVHDDGVGFTPAQVRDECYGLIGMRERAQQIAALLTVQSAPGQGTTIAVAVPVADTKLRSAV